MQNNKDQRDHPVKPARFWIVGAGRFGKIAVERITRHIPGALLTVVDQRPAMTGGANISVIREDGIRWLSAMLGETAPVDMIVPAIPVHVVCDWLKLNLRDTFDIHPIDIPDAWLSPMPNAIRGKAGQAYVSHADFICPDNCPEPEKTCTHTGKPRPMDLFRLLGNLEIDGVLSIVIRSYQLLPGVGGIYPGDLLGSADIIRKNRPHRLMIGTACRCHGVVDFMRLEKAAKRGGRAKPFS
jgi:hypothetical protein